MRRWLTGAQSSPVDPDALLITAGNSQAISHTAMAFSQHNKRVFVEEPTYFLAFDLFRELGLDLASVPVDAHGLDVRIVNKSSPHYGSDRMSSQWTLCVNRLVHVVSCRSMHWRRGSRAATSRRSSTRSHSSTTRRGRCCPSSAGSGWSRSPRSTRSTSSRTSRTTC